MFPLYIKLSTIKWQWRRKDDIDEHVQNQLYIYFFYIIIFILKWHTYNTKWQIYVKSNMNVHMLPSVRGILSFCLPTQGLTRVGDIWNDNDVGKMTLTITCKINYISLGYLHLNVYISKTAWNIGMTFWHTPSRCYWNIKIQKLKIWILLIWTHFLSYLHVYAYIFNLFNYLKV